MTPPAEVLAGMRVRGVSYLVRANFPMIMVYEGRNYIVRATPRGGLIMERYGPAAPAAESAPPAAGGVETGSGPAGAA